MAFSQYLNFIGVKNLLDMYTYAFTYVLLTDVINKTILGSCKVQKGWLKLEEKLQIQLRLATQSN